MSHRPKLRRTRIVCISDTHNCTVKLPPGDVLIHAGDLTNQGTHSELSRTVKWLRDANFEAKIVIAGNHDITLDKTFYEEQGHTLHTRNPQSHEACFALLSDPSNGITYLDHTSTIIRLTSPSGPGTHFKVFGSPRTPRNYSATSSGLQAFGYDTPSNPGAQFHNLPDLWDAMPLDADIVVTHTPARTHCDEKEDERRARGCEALRRRLWRVRPRLAVCGHVHDGRGAERVTWDLTSRNAAFAERAVTHWTDPAPVGSVSSSSSKISLVDLTGRKAPSLANDGSHAMTTAAKGTTAAAAQSAFPRATSNSSPAGDVDAQVCSSTIGLGCCKDSLASPSPDDANNTNTISSVDSPRCDREALSGRMGREETCIVNAAIMKSRYPHVGGKTFHKPIVVDVNLPVWQQDS